MFLFFAALGYLHQVPVGQCSASHFQRPHIERIASRRVFGEGIFRFSVMTW
jgi:hypothetical protein